MSMTAGTRLDRYAIADLIGRGAMGEVYRAHDSRLGRDVAIKVLPVAFSSDPERLRRFDQEARAAGALNHPNIVAIFDVGTHDGAPFVVTELLVGETLRSRLDNGAVSARKALEYAVQIANGLAAAHAKGIVHRDLKPENLFVTSAGHIKILDFGLAKLTRAEGHTGAQADSLMATAMTEMGRVMGTVGYMAPEQVRGEVADHRADLFSFGCVLYEMLNGRSPFHRESAIESMAAIVRDEPPALPAEVVILMPGLAPLLRRCVEKHPSERFESARDLAFSLELLAQTAGSASAAPSAADLETDPDVKYQRITFRRGAIWSARFSPDGNSVVYSASWEGKPLELFWAHIGNPEARALGFRDTDLLSVSHTNEMAVLLRAEFVTSFDRRGTLARVPPMGGAARELLHDVHGADWSPDGTQIAVVREKLGMTRLEFPLGNVLYQTPGWISIVRISSDGQVLAFIDHPSRNSDSGHVCVVDRKGERRVLSASWGTLRGLAWSADGKEVWFTADRGGAARGLYAVTLEGKLRRVLQLASNMTLHDLARDGRVLLGHGPERAGINAFEPGENRERDLSWLDWSLLQDISDDGRTFLLDETAEGGGAMGSVYIRATDGSPAVRLGDGAGRALSVDGQWVVAGGVASLEEGRLQLLPTGVGEPREIQTKNLYCHMARWFPDGQHLVVTGHEPGHGIRLYRVDSLSGEAQALSPEGINPIEFHALPDGSGVAAVGADEEHWIYPVDGGDPHPATGLDRADRLVRWMDDMKTVLVYRSNELPARIYSVDMETLERKVWRELTPPDPTGIYRIGRVRTSADGKIYGYVYYMQLVDLHVITGLK
ncbi:MAG: protein kinase [Candidatus Eisenbacteria bacterium]